MNEKKRGSFMLKDMNFARISRSVIINFENVNTIGDEIIMTDGVKLKSSRRMKKQIQVKL